MKLNKWLLTILLGTSACSTGNPGTSNTTVTGSVSGATSELVRTLTSNGCFADTVLATDNSGNSTSADVEQDCNFSLTLTTGKSYILSFLEGGDFVATLVFDSGRGNTDDTFHLPDGTVDFSLGSITINGSTAISQRNPLDYCDSDHDGHSNYDDSDDDDDGIGDDSESDCDYDGVRDDYDDDHPSDSSCSDSNPGVGDVLRVRPSSIREDVDLDKEVKIYVACEIDSTTVNETTFVVENESGDPITCDYEVSANIYDVSEVKCRHDADRFSAGSTYTVTFAGVMCGGGTPAQEVEFSFDTETDDSGEGCYEDDLDDEYESSDDSDDESDDSDSDDDDDNDDSDLDSTDD